MRPGHPGVHVGPRRHQRGDARRTVWEVPRPVSDHVQEGAPYAIALQSCSRQARALTQQLLERRNVTGADRCHRRHGNRLVSVDDRRILGIHLL